MCQAQWLTLEKRHTSSLKVLTKWYGRQRVMRWLPPSLPNTVTKEHTGEMWEHRQKASEGRLPGRPGAWAVFCRSDTMKRGYHGTPSPEKSMCKGTATWERVAREGTYSSSFKAWDLVDRGVAREVGRGWDLRTLWAISEIWDFTLRAIGIHWRV